jgi:hypothetical protein
MPPGLDFDPDSGVIGGTPTTAGVWKFQVAVRDKNKGETAYNGDGFWFAWAREKIDGKSWYQSKSVTRIVVLERPGAGKEVTLNCAATAGTKEFMMLRLDLANGYVFQFNAQAKVSWLGKIDPDADVLGWETDFGQYSLDRSNGDLHASSPAYSAPLAWHCEKRSANRAF